MTTTAPASGLKESLPMPGNTIRMFTISGDEIHAEVIAVAAASHPAGIVGHVEYRNVGNGPQHGRRALVSIANIDAWTDDHKQWHY